MPHLTPGLIGKFIETIPFSFSEDIVDGADPYKFGQKLGLSEQELRSLGLCDANGQLGALSRSMLRQRCDSARTDLELKGAILSIFAWGGMGHGHPVRIWKSPTVMPTLIKIIRDMRTKGKDLDPVAAFRLFREARLKGDLKYIGVSFYTKILFFFFPGSPEVEASILDQFSAKSINALFDNQAVPMWGDMPAEPADPAKASAMYARYLKCLDILRSTVQERTHRSLTSSQIEWLLFRPDPDSWRASVAIANGSNKTRKGEKRC